MAAEIRLWRAAIVSSMCGKHCLRRHPSYPTTTPFSSTLSPKWLVNIRRSYEKKIVFNPNGIVDRKDNKKIKILIQYIYGVLILSSRRNNESADG